MLDKFHCRVGTLEKMWPFLLVPWKHTDLLRFRKSFFKAKGNWWNWQKCIGISTPRSARPWKRTLVSLEVKVHWIAFDHCTIQKEYQMEFFGDEALINNSSYFRRVCIHCSYSLLVSDKVYRWYKVNPLHFGLESGCCLVTMYATALMRPNRPPFLMPYQNTKHALDF